jgi:hypothetical protein
LRKTYPCGNTPKSNKNLKNFSSRETFVRQVRTYPHKATVTATKVVFKVAPEALQCAGKEKSFQGPL